MVAKNTICLWYDGTALNAAKFYAVTFPDSAGRNGPRAPASRRARSLPQSPIPIDRRDVVLLDLNLPGITGLELGRRARAAPWGRGISLIALTGIGQASDIASTVEAGFDHHVTKPARPDEILKLVA